MRKMTSPKVSILFRKREALSIEHTKNMFKISNV